MKQILACVVGLGLLCLFSEVVKAELAQKANYLNQNWNPRVTHKVFFDVTQNNVFLGRIVFGLFGEIVPKSVANFVALAEGVTETNADGGKTWRTYKGTKIHRVIDGFVVQGGDITHGDGRGSWSIFEEYQHGNFPDENFILNHYGAGWLNYANFGPNSNGAQWAILTRDTPWLNGKHVVFAVVLEGMGVVDYIQRTETKTGDVPEADIIISDSGSLPVSKPFGVDRAPRGFPLPRQPKHP